MGFLDHDDDKSKKVDDSKVTLREEELDIAKNKVHTGEVTLSKEIVEEHKSVNVPVMHEEVVIERRAIDHEPSEDPIGEEEMIRIPVTEEKVEVGKHTVVTGEVSAYKREVEDTEEVDAVLKREEARVDTEGDPNIIADKNDENHLE
jgi:uncharacterized protein (TIGR02271 family)